MRGKEMLTNVKKSLKNTKKLIMIFVGNRKGKKILTILKREQKKNMKNLMVITIGKFYKVKVPKMETTFVDISGEQIYS